MCPPMKLSTAVLLLVATRVATPDEPTPSEEGEGRVLPSGETRSSRRWPGA